MEAGSGVAAMCRRHECRSGRSEAVRDGFGTEGIDDDDGKRDENGAAGVAGLGGGGFGKRIFSSDALGRRPGCFVSIAFR
jgi:hypothetical protein